MLLNINLDPPLKMAVINKMVSIFSNFIGLRLRRRFIKDSSPFDHHEALNGNPIGIFGGFGLSIGKEEALEGDMSCCVCLSRLEGEGDTRVLPCLHVFHRVCIDKWFSSCRRTCPVCRFLVVEEEEKKRDQEEELTEEMVIWFSSFHGAGF